MSSVENEPDRAHEVSPLLPVFRNSTVTDLVEHIADEDAWDADSVGYTSTVFAQTCLPYKDPMRANPNLRAWSRKNGNMILRVEPALLTAPDGSERFEIPFGKYPRLILPWLTTQIFERREHLESDGSLTINFSASLRRFLDQLGGTWGGNSGQLLIEQLPRLFGGRISVTEVKR